MQASSPPPPVDPEHRLRAAPGAPRPSAAGDEASPVLDRVRAELATLRAKVLGLQDALGPTLAAAAADEAVLRSGQELDLVAQTLDGLSTFLGALARGGLRAGRLDAAGAASHVRLDGLASRLAGRAPAGPLDDGGGDVELF